MSCRSALLLFALGAAPIFAQSADDVVRETKRLKAQADQERRLYVADSIRQAEWARQSRERLATMRAEAARLGRQRDSLRAFVDRGLRAPPPPPPTPAGVVQRQAFAVAVAQKIDTALGLLGNVGEIASSRSDLEAVSRSLKSGKTDAAEGIARLFDTWAEGLEAALRISARPGTHTTSTGRALRGTYLQLGTLSEIFVDGTAEYAAIRETGDSGWRPVSDAKLRTSLRQAADRLAGDGTPGWVWLPRVQEAKP
ncbi:MAG: hypothetical protein H6686_04160 [Fibrobacteria bacterium]|nr:hypothetical protein [Fibrobacteria bacterium]